MVASYEFSLPIFGGKDGSLGTIENNTVPGFQIKRIFYIYDVPEGESRANHACMNADMIFISITGSVTLAIENNNVKKEYILDGPDKAIFAPADSWIIAENFSRGAVLLGLSDKQYIDCNYIEDYQKYKEGKTK